MNKQKLLTNAQKQADKGNYAKAIKEYQRALALEPSDVRVLQKIGDLQSKKGDADEAVKTYVRIAQHYSATGFGLKAAAMYKRALKLDAKHTEVYIALGDVYHQLGRMPDALSCFTNAAEQLLEQGNVARYAETMRHILALDPEDVGTHIKFAEFLSKHNDKAGAIESLQTATTLLRDEGRLDDYVKVAERLLFLAPNSTQHALELVQVYREQGEPRIALAKLQPLFKQNPQNTEILGILSEIFRDLGQDEKSLQVRREKARSHARQGQNTQAQDDWQRILDTNPNDQEASRELNALRGNPSPAAPPAQGIALPSTPNLSVPHTQPPTQAQQPPPAPNTVSPFTIDEEVEAILVETDVYIKYGLFDQALGHLQRAFERYPNCLDAIERLKDIHYRQNDFDSTIRELVRMASLARPYDVDLCVSYLREAAQVSPEHPLVSQSLDAWGFTWETLFPPPQIADLDPNEFGDLLSVDEMLNDLADQDGILNAGAHSLDLHDSLTSSHNINAFLEPFSEEDDLLNASLSDVSSLDDLGEDLESVLDTYEVSPNQLTIQDPAAYQLQPNQDFAHRAPTNPYSYSQHNGPASSNTPPPANAIDVFDPPPLQNATPLPVTYDLSSIPSKLASSLNLCDQWIAQGASKLAQQTLDDLAQTWPNHPEILDRVARLQNISQPPPHNETPFPPAYDSGSLQALTPNTLTETPLPALLHSVGSMNPHIELGLAFRGLGLYQDAVEELQHATENSSLVDHALFWMAQCYMEVGDFGEAANLFIHASQYATQDPELMRHIYYRLGLAYAQIGYQAEAIECFQNLQDSQEMFPDIGERLRRLNTPA